MSRGAKWALAIGGVLITALLAWIVTNMLGLADMGGTDEGLTTDITEAGEEPSARLCSAQGTADAIRAQIFETARGASADADALRRLESDTLVRLDEAKLERYDDARDIAECKARLVIELPRGSEPAFNYDRRLTAEIDFSVRGGTGAIAQLNRAEMVISDLAAADLSVRDRRFDDPYSNTEDPIGSLLDDIEGDPGDRPDQPAQRNPRPRQGPPADGDPVDLLPPAMDGDAQGR